MSSENAVRFPGLVPALIVSTLALALAACQKDPTHRTKRARPHPAPTTPAAAADEDPPAPPAPPPAAPAPAPVAAAPAPLRPRHELSVDRSVPARPRPAAAVAAVRAPAPAPTPAPAPAYKAVVDNVRPLSRCDGGSGKGERLSVQGVAANDVLNVREAPDKASAILGELPPDATGVRGTANRRRIGSSMWREVECGKLRGWVNERFLARESGNN